MDLKNKCKAEPATILRRFVAAWLTAAAVEYLLLPESLRSLTALDGLAQMSLLRLVLAGCGVFGGLTVLSRWEKLARIESWLIPAAFLVLMIASVPGEEVEGFDLACWFALGLMIVYAVFGTGKPLPQIRREERLCAGITAVLTMLFFAFVANWTVCRVRSFCTSTYDFGIFAQMFHNMRTTGLPVTTLERDGLLSHFAVHVSPIYYLLLPFYCLWPRAETLQVLQALVLASAVIPLWKLGKAHGLAPATRMLMCVLLLVYPAYSAGTSYDIHENAFLTPLLFWLFYGIDRKNWKITAVAAVLTLMVKEDAAVYVAVIALWLLVRTAVSNGEKRWGLTAGGAMIAGALVYFLAVTGYLANSGDGVMTGRYSNLMYDGSDSLVTVVKAVLLEPLKILHECVEPEKLKYITLTMAPLVCLPLFTRRYERLILLIPYILVNLISDYQYQHDIFFQYSYGSLTCLFYMTLVNVADWRQEWKRLTALVVAVVIGGICLGWEVVPKAISYPEYCEEYGEYYDELRTALAKIPEDASVAATTFLTPELSRRAELYDVRYAAQEHVLGADYVALKPSDEWSFQECAVDGGNGYENLIALLAENGFTLFEEIPGALEIYRKG